jgi:2-oxoisovalerate dehydrogenase E1 component
MQNHVAFTLSRAIRRRMFDRPTIIDEAFVRRVAVHDFPAARSNNAPIAAPAHKLVDLFDSQIMSRHLDLWARRSKGKTFYSIGSSGHEGTAAMAAATRTTIIATARFSFSARSRPVD